ncbi:MAG: hypothetical protein K2M79_03485 [Muribaculaceae bacterium]|nr:hypothetical protein [Muribaculaceae bacterium]
MNRCLLILFIFWASVVSAQPRHTLSVLAGSAHTADTYLSPLKYSGASTGIAYDYKRLYQPSMFSLSTQLRGSRTMNPARNAVMWGADLMLSSHYMWRLPVPSAIASVYLGSGASIAAGALYLPRNGNNPVSASARICADAAIHCTHDISIHHRPLTFSLTATLPVTGAFFRQAYGELYYEIYMGNHSHLIHWAHPGNLLAPDIRAAVSTTVGKIYLTGAYTLNVENSYSHSITHRCIYHSFAAGISF